MERLFLPAFAYFVYSAVLLPLRLRLGRAAFFSVHSIPLPVPDARPGT